MRWLLWAALPALIAAGCGDGLYGPPMTQAATGEDTGVVDAGAESGAPASDGPVPERPEEPPDAAEPVQCKRYDYAGSGDEPLVAGEAVVRVPSLAVSQVTELCLSLEPPSSSRRGALGGRSYQLRVSGSFMKHLLFEVKVDALVSAGGLGIEDVDIGYVKNDRGTKLWIPSSVNLRRDRDAGVVSAELYHSFFVDGKLEVAPVRSCASQRPCPATFSCISNVCQ